MQNVVVQITVEDCLVSREALGIVDRYSLQYWKWRLWKWRL
jgi:hypothetical protein